MEERAIDKKLDSIEQRLGQLESGKKDAWDKISILMAVLVPAAIALAGHFIAQSISTAEIASQERQAAQSRIIARENTRIAQAELINTFMQSLTSEDSDERKIAIKAILIALPNQGPALVREVARFDEDQTVQQTARASLNQRLLRLIEELFAEEAAVRQTAAQELIAGWQSDIELIPALITYARNHFSNANGVYNAVVILNALEADHLAKHRDQILRFLEQAKRNGQKTKRIAEQVEARI